jgi:hypothetical protein
MVVFRIRQVFIIVSGVIFFLNGMGGCSFMNRDHQASGKTIEQVLQEHTSQWMAIPGVEGTAIGLFEGKSCIKIFSSKKAEDLREVIPPTVESYPIIIEETGTFRALDR